MTAAVRLVADIAGTCLALPAEGLERGELIDDHLVLYIGNLTIILAILRYGNLHQAGHKDARAAYLHEVGLDGAYRRTERVRLRR